MRTLRCKCGEGTMWTTDSPFDCQGCHKCNTTYAGHPDGHKPLQPHTWKIMYNQNTGKPYKRCDKCSAIDEESYKESRKKDNDDLIIVLPPDEDIDDNGKYIGKDPFFIDEESRKTEDDIYDDKGNVKGAKTYDKPAQLAPDPEPIFPTSTPVPQPKTLDEAIQILTDQLTTEIDDIMMTKEDEFTTQSHHGMGRFLRNEWGLWGGSDIQKWFKERGIHHADDMSDIILTSFHRKLHNVDIDLDKQIKHYIRYWNFHNPDINKGILQ